MSENTLTAETSAPAFPGKVVALMEANSFYVVALSECRFERIAGRMFLVGHNVQTNHPYNLEVGVTRAVAWDSKLAQNFILFDSEDAFRRWIRTTADEGGVEGGDIPF
jgi:hypothetical protein